MTDLTEDPSRGVHDTELELVAAHLASLDHDGQRFADVLRATLDQLLDGRRNGRYEYQKLHKTEKTHMGTLVEINLHREFEFDDGDVTDYRIAGVEVDCKFSQRIGGWEMGPEMVGHLCLVVTASDQNSSWRAGLVRATEMHLRSVQNRDAKRRLNEAGVAAIRWLWPEHGKLAENLLLHLDPETCKRIMNAEGRNQRHGQARIFQLFREVRVQGIILRRTIIETVGHGLDDPMKRARGNGGARDALRPDGILVLGHQDNDPLVARALGLPVPKKGELVAARVTPAPAIPDERPTAEVNGTYWVVARSEDEPIAAPVIPRKRAEGNL
ncbi:NaeI family type II restriction endonuclease [Streptomyces sp. V1I1]|uniref:NaeI family type II restriction endonuclease n=1 Tax=Streptomyces sp. V1I1 TaxID=3042272 RepID=UPI0027D8E8DC|nr:NaeI family type II restriction endonuclease [Streptomyces sp. V1I1]